MELSRLLRSVLSLLFSRQRHDYGSGLICSCGEYTHQPAASSWQQEDPTNVVSAGELIVPPLRCIISHSSCLQDANIYICIGDTLLTKVWLFCDIIRPWTPKCKAMRVKYCACACFKTKISPGWCVVLLGNHKMLSWAKNVVHDVTDSRLWNYNIPLGDEIL